MASTVLKTENAGFRVVLLGVDQLKPHEKGSPLYLELLRKEIIKDGMLKYPIIADETSYVILDGMHRWLVLKSLGYELVPVILVNVFQNQKIRIGKRRVQRYASVIDKEIPVRQVISAGVTGQLMEPRTTRHFFPFSKFQEINCPLHSLRRNVPEDVSRYLSKMSDEECSLAMEQWLEEMCEELEFLSKRIAEVEKEKREFLDRVKSLAVGL